MLGDHRQLSSFYQFVPGRHRRTPLFDACVVLRGVPGVFLFTVQCGRGGVVSRLSAVAVSGGRCEV